MENLFIAEVLQESGMLSVPQGINLFYLLSQVLLQELEGEIVELGCCHGNTAVMLQKTLDLYGSAKELHVFDSFEGLPEKHLKDQGTSLKKGGCGSNRKILERRFRRFNTKLPYIHEGWFKDTEGELPDKICFVHLDFDFYESTRDALRAIYSRLVPGAVVVLDDYCDKEFASKVKQLYENNVFAKKAELALKENPNICPGVFTACEEFFRDKPEQISSLLSGYAPHGYFKKQ
jgi:O-methyltransferase